LTEPPLQEFLFKRRDNIGPNSHRRIDPINAHLPNRRPTHRAPGVLSSAERRKMYDAARPSPSRIYGRRWQRLRLA
jgi:hypothetical protein